jgi:tRNA(Ile2) C34 agmatinyltransferase TiaS
MFKKSNKTCSKKQPSELFFETSIKANQTFSELIPDKYETEFLRSGKQRIILRELTMLKLEKYVEEINDKCILCNKTLKSILILK